MDEVITRQEPCEHGQPPIVKNNILKVSHRGTSAVMWICIPATGFLRLEDACQVGNCYHWLGEARVK